MLNQIISTMIVGGMTLIGAVVTMAPENVRVPAPLSQSTKSDMAASLPFLTDDTGMRMRAVIAKRRSRKRQSRFMMDQWGGPPSPPS